MHKAVLKFRWAPVETCLSLAKQSFAPVSAKADKWLHKAGDFLKQQLAL
tara:strand:+ start:4648 stop:4794 length:147 start_codon:yes stop_codon:yes gene_type:complete